MSSAAPTEPPSQYHHFIPRFILKNFSHPYNPPNAHHFATRGKRKRVGGYFVGEPMLHAINLAGAVAKITETPVAKTFGQTDFYRDFAHASDQHHIERQLSLLETQAGRVIGKIRKAFEAGQADIWVTRTDRDTLRKFLFIMKYRGSSFHMRYNHQHIDDYNECDKERMRRYMREKGFQKPIDVWFDNIKAILELELDTAFNWTDAIEKRIYPDDAKWFTNNMQGYYLALCTPNLPDDDNFLLTENAYSIHEGSNSYTIDPLTSEMILKCYTEAHIFAPISPRLIIVLRSALLPNHLEDANEKTRKWREKLMDLTTIQHNDPAEGITVLEDLPVMKAHNSYSKVENGRIVTLDGKPHYPRPGDKFCLRFFPISTDHVGKINAVMLQESQRISTITFNSPRVARRALEYYFSMSCHGGKIKGVSGAPDDPQLVCLKKLEQAARLLGSTTVAIYETLTPTEMGEEKMFEILGRRLEKSMPKDLNSRMGPYVNLGKSLPCTACSRIKSLLYTPPGGNPATLPKDMDQSSKMLNMRIKVDVWSQGLTQEVREEIREKVRDLFCGYMAPRRVYFYLKQIRVMKTVGPEVWRNRDVANFEGAEMSGMEDIVANASQLFRDAESLCQTMHQAALNEILLTENPDYGIRGQLTLDNEGGRRYQEEKYLVFGPLGRYTWCSSRFFALF
ncbi:hypothetical protein GP486_001495 [Trichoglossum hirsutum]|uniref:Uncharacterized protein n=1 Tax=Trichoglossum hirsutum TaxID=265104 RepID=A0A9P8RSM4_9PEZI|nr:hypothetical protein GP486_001495 [Trichoglossum hirsutum]